MNILITASNHRGPSWVAFTLESLDLELKHHKDLYDAIQSHFKPPVEVWGENLKVSKKFGEVISLLHGELYEEKSFIINMLQAQAEFEDPDSEDYDPRYPNISLHPPFQIDAVIELITFE